MRKVMYPQLMRIFIQLFSILTIKHSYIFPIISIKNINKKTNTIYAIHVSACYLTRKASSLSATQMEKTRYLKYKIKHRLVKQKKIKNVLQKEVKNK